MPGVVSLPHGWGHDAPSARLSVAAEHAGVNSNVLADTELFDPVSGTAVLNGIPVEVVAAARPDVPRLVTHRYRTGDPPPSPACPPLHMPGTARPERPPDGEQAD